MRNESHWKDSNALVTGGASFIGSHLVDALVSRGVNVTVLDDLSSGKLDNLSQSLHKVKFVTHNLEYNAKDVLKTIFKEQDYVFHMAAQAGVRYSIARPEVYFQSNLLGFFNILESCRKTNVKHLIYMN